MWVARILDYLRGTYWFLPLVQTSFAVALAFAVVSLDRHLHLDAGPGTWWVYSGGAEGARQVLATIAGSMITVAGVVFSITIVALSLASNQFGPRLLRNFMRDRRNQLVLGTFTATFLYCLLVLRTVRGTEDRSFVPGIAVALGIFFSIASLGVLIYFIHHVATSIQVGELIQRVTEDLDAAIDRLWPEDLGDEVPIEQPPQFCNPPGDPAAVVATGDGYLDAVDTERILQLARQQNVVLRLDRKPGDFIVTGSILASVWPAAAATDEIQAEIRQAVALTHQRSPFQDAAFLVEQLVEVAVRALSPGVNDPFTAETCIDRLGQAMCRLARRDMPSPLRYDAEKQLRVITHPLTFGDLVDSAFERIREYGSGSPGVLGRTMDTIGVIGRQVHRASDRVHLRRHLELLFRAGMRKIAAPEDRSVIQNRYAAAMAIVSQADGGMRPAVAACRVQSLSGQELPRKEWPGFKT